jgi:hypothetical protein
MDKYRQLQKEQLKNRRNNKGKEEEPEMTEDANA